MRVDVVWLAALALTLPAVSRCDPLFVLTAPNLLRLGTREKVFVEAQEYTGQPLKVEILVKDFPAKVTEILSKSVTLSDGNNFQAVQEILIPERYFVNDKNSKQYIYLQAKFPDRVLEKVVLVSFQSGYLFVQTDKPIYVPEDTVLYRIFSVSPDLVPISNGVSVEIMNPDGITVKQNFLYPTRGIISSNYKLPEIVREGTWKVVCGFGKNPQNLFTAEFEVKEHVLPNFEVKLTPGKSFFHVDDTELTIDITAKYLYGKDVSGKAFVVFGVLTDNGQKIGIPASLQRVNIDSGKGKAKLTRQQILTTFPNIKELDKMSLYVSVSVLTSTGSEMVETERRGIQIVTSPYTIHFKKTPTYFKPGMPFDIVVYVTNPDNTPAKDIAVEETKAKVSATTKENGVAKLTINTQDGISTLSINVVTKVAKLADSQQAKQHMEAKPYKTQGSKNYLHISLQAIEIKAGGDMGISFYLVNSPLVQNEIKHLTYLVMSKGKLILAKRYKRAKGQSLISLNVPVTKDMVPSFRIVAYYHVGMEVVSDSIWVDVKDTCMGTLKVASHDQPRYEPRLPFSLTITGDPGAKVGLVAVDKGVYVLNNKNRLTQTKIWDIVEKQDIGCTTGSGADSMAVFYDAGLLFVSNAGETVARAEPKCPVRPTGRRRRAPTLMELKHSLVRNCTVAERKCCMDGMVDNLLGYTCERRAQFIVDSEECVKAFVRCCLEVEKKTQEARAEELILQRSDQDDGYFNEFSDILSRTQFPASWLWDDLELPPCPAGNEECESTSIETNSFLKDSITTWEVTAISLSETHGICVADPFEMKVMKSFFVDLKLPYAAVRNEQLELKAVLYNYINTEITVRVQLLETEHVCSAASKKRMDVIAQVKVDKMSSRAVPFVIIPLALGQHSIEVKAYVVGFEFKDGVKKDLRVVAEGQRTEMKRATVLLNPAGHGGVQTETIFPVNLRFMVPGSMPQTHISVTGDPLSQTVDAAISGTNMAHLIKQPTGCGEQNMMRITGPLIATLYLDKTGQWDKVGLDRRGEALRHITTGYERQLTYRQNDGSYRIYPRAPYVPSTWLTAYVAKVFGLAYNLIFIKEDVLCSALKWLVLNTQQPDGIFKEVGQVYQSELMGGVNDKDPEVALTAFVLIAMRESSHICVERIPSLTNSMKSASKFLSENIQKLTNPYAVALTSYALAREGQHHLDILNRYSSGGGTYWQVPNKYFFTLEATGYALMTLVKAKKFDQAGRVVEWLTQQRFYGGFYGSTQATVIVFQALALYMTELPEKSPTDLSVTMSMSGRQRPTTWTYTTDTMHVTRSTKIPLNQNMTFTAKGTGQGTLSVMTIYNALPEENKADCKNFELEVTIQKQRKASDPTALETYILTIDMTYKPSSSKSTMSILDVTMLTGFTADQTDLEKLTAGKDQYVKKIEMNTQLSEKGSLIFYLDKVSHQLPDRVAFRIHKITNVGLLQPAAVTLYEYNSWENRCMKFYHPEKKNGTLNRICHEDVCRCAEENCSFQRKENKELDRVSTACSAGMDYVYKAKVIEVELSPAIDRFTILVTETVKEGTDTDVKGKERMYLAHPYCREAISLIKGKTYLIMGSYSSLVIEKDRTMYMLGGDTWIEHWPTETECQESANRQTCLSLFEDTDDLSTFGCPS
ncbi:complement C3-like [Anguilla rostrata]|uniref:complement C3-like n=1 Tax=Anguilla rostrata TaxID=7938 RepID=UPI0030D52169